MQLPQRYLDALSTIVSAGAVGASLLMGSVLPAAASLPPPGISPDGASDGAKADVAERLAAIRAATSAVIEPGQADGNVQLVWGNRWNNSGWGRPPGWGRPRWNNWNNWRNGRPNWNNWWRNW